MFVRKWLGPGLAGTLLVSLFACSGSTNLSEGFSLSEQPLIGKIVWHDLMTDDPAESRRFYGEQSVDHDRGLPCLHHALRLRNP